MDAVGGSLWKFLEIMDNKKQLNSSSLPAECLLKLFNSSDRRIGCTWNSKQPVFIGCFNWMIPNHYIKNGCFTKHPLKNGCLGYRVCENLWPSSWSRHHEISEAYLIDLDV